MSFLTKIFSSGASTLVESVGNTLDNLITSKDEVMQHQNELKKAEMQYLLELQKLDVEQQKNILEDIDSARKRNAEVITSTNAGFLSKNITAFLAIGSTVLTFVLFYIIIFRNDTIKAEVKDVVLYLLGVFSAIITQVFSFYFGSSQGSSEKNRIIEQIKNKTT
jgi:predicted PurR-regulated permease PerM